MKKPYQRYHYKSHNVTKLPVYKKALYIFKLSRQIVEYLRGDTSVLDLHRSKFVSDQFSDKLIMESLGLAPKIAMAEATPDPNIKLESLSSIQKTTAILLHYCEKLETNHAHAREFLSLLRKEVMLFGDLQNKWALNLSNKN